MLSWIEENIIEIIGVLFALTYLILEIEERWTMWPIGIISSAFYIFIFFQSKIYAQMVLNSYFLFVNLYGLYCWKLSPQAEDNPLKIRRLKLKEGMLLFLIFIIFFVFIGILLDRMTDSIVPYPDALLAALSMVASWMVARKILDHWFVWIFVNIFSVGLYYYLRLYPTSVLYFIYAIMSFVGLLQWRRSMFKQMRL